jgi:F420-0:gamma-glutamyl ligase
MTKTPHLTVIPVKAPVQQAAFDLQQTLIDSLAAADEHLQDGDILAVSSKYAAISEGRIVTLAEVEITPEADTLAQRYNMHPGMAQLVLQEADHIFGGIQMGFLLTHNTGIISPNAGLDRSNIPSGQVVLFPSDPYRTAAIIRRQTAERLNADIALCVCAQMVMGERDEATPFAIIRHSGVPIVEVELSVQDVAIPWEMCIYVESLTTGRLTQPLSELVRSM